MAVTISRDFNFENSENVKVEQFHSCNAFERYVYGSDGELDSIEFVSYCTPIAKLVKNGYGSDTLIVSGMYNCSGTTIRQFGRWLREVTPLCYQDVKHMFEVATTATVKPAYLVCTYGYEFVGGFSRELIESKHPFFASLYDSVKPFCNY